MKTSAVVILALISASLFVACGSTSSTQQSPADTTGEAPAPIVQSTPATPSHSGSAATAATLDVPVIPRSANGVEVNLNGVDLEGRFIVTHFRVMPADPITHPDLGQYGVLGFLGAFPSVDMQLGGLTWLQQYFPIVKPIDPVKNPAYPATPQALQYKSAKAYDVTIAFKLKAAPSDPVTINIARLLFNKPERKVVNGPWQFEFVPDKLARKKPAPSIASDETVGNIQLALDALKDAGLVFPINKTVAYGGQQITLLDIACDRDITYLTYRTDDGQPIDPSEITGHNAKMAFLQPDLAASPIIPPLPVSASPTNVYWVAFSGLPAETRMIYLQLGPGRAGRPPVGLGTPVPNLNGGGKTVRFPRIAPLSVDLSPLAKLPAAQLISGQQGQATGHGMQFQAVQLRRGYAVSTVGISASTVDPKLLVPAKPPATPRDALTSMPQVTVDDQPVTVVENAVQARDGVATDDLRIMNLPNHGTLRITLDRQFVDFVSGRQVAYAKGPWMLTMDLAKIN